MMVDFSDFSFTYKSQRVPTLKHVDLHVREGEKLLIIGPSGSGKSTLGNCINGLIPHAVQGKIEGSLKVSSMETVDTDIYDLNQKVGTVLQDTDGQFVGLSVAEDIAFSLENQCVAKPRMEGLVLEMASLVDMEAFLAQPPGALSGGQKQRVSLAGVLVDDVDILLFDEPLANLDPATGKRAIELIDELHKRTGKTIVIIEHRLEDVLHRPVDRIILVDDGRICLDTTPAVLLASSMLQEKGIREPLYISALKLAGCGIAPTEDIAYIDTFHAEPYARRLRSWFTERRKRYHPPEGEELIRFDHISYSYDGLRDAVHDMSFSIREGEMVSVLGKNGAGKSTMAQLLMGILKPDAGRILLAGNDATGDTICERSRKIGYVMQNPNHMISHPLIYDEVAFGLRLKGLPEDMVRKRVMDALELCGLHKHHKWPISALSYGQKKRVTIASILVMDPEVLILDEPTAGQDYKRYTALMTFLRDINRRLGITILFVTHDMHLALEYTPRAIVLADGRLLRDAPVSEVFSDEELLRQANLKETSLYTLAQRAGIPQSDIPSFIETFIDAEDERRQTAAKIPSSDIGWTADPDAVSPVGLNQTIDRPKSQTDDFLAVFSLNEGGQAEFDIASTGEFDSVSGARMKWGAVELHENISEDSSVRPCSLDIQNEGPENCSCASIDAVVSNSKEETQGIMESVAEGERLGGADAMGGKSVESDGVKSDGIASDDAPAGSSGTSGNGGANTGPTEGKGRKFGFGLSYLDTGSWIHHLNGVTKFLFFIGWMILCLTTFDIRILLTGLCVSIIAMLTCEVPFRKFRPLLVAMLGVITLNALFIYLFSPGQGTLYLGTRTVLLGPPEAKYALTAETLFYLVVVCLKYFTIFPIALVFVFCTQPSEFASSLNRIGVSYKIAYAVSLALRYIPEITDDFIHIMHAQQARGVDISKNVPLRRRISNVSKVLAPLVLSSIDRIDVITNAMVLRGFGKGKRRTWYRAAPMRGPDYLVVFGCLLLLAVSLTFRFGFGVMFWYPF